MHNRVARRFFQALYRQLVAKMTPQDALGILGFPPNSSPSADEIKKVYRQKAIENHPDRGGDLEKMKLINVAKDVLDGTTGQAWRPEPAPVTEYPHVEGQSWEAVKSSIPTGVTWKVVSRPTFWAPISYYPYTRLFLAYGEKEGGAGFVLGITHRLASSAALPRVGGRGGEDKVWIDEECAVRVERFNAGADPTKKMVALFKSLLGGWGEASFDPPKKWVVWPEGTAITPKTLTAATRSGGVALKDALLGAGVGGAASGGADRKTQVEVRVEPNAEKLHAQHGSGGVEVCDMYVSVNGKDFKLADDTVKNLDEVYFFNDFVDIRGTYNGRIVKVNLTRLRGSRMKPGAASALRKLADALTSEPSGLLMALYAAAESYEEPEDKKAALRALVASMPLESVATLLGTDLMDVFYATI